MSLGKRLGLLVASAISSLFLEVKKTLPRDFPGGPVAKTLHFQCVCVCACVCVCVCVCLEVGVGQGLGSIPSWRARSCMPQRKISHEAMKIEAPAYCNEDLAQPNK